ncbi:MAG: hypothetical protein KBF97_03860 [Bacteroidetes bacterium]|nr:hypothetical protein [Bacteroidota bacterium]
MKQFRLPLIAALIITAAVMLTAQSKEKYEQPILITSAGQSADVTMAAMLCKKVGLNAKAVTRATAADVKDVKTLIIVPGFSSKGLGAAGISREQEMERVKEVIAAAQKQKIRILLLHIGGKPRRGQQSDDFNKLCGEASLHMIVVKQGNEDNFFTEISTSKKIGLDVVEKIAEAAKPLEASFVKN